ncbi:MAG: hypothetical protein LH614_16425 [Pyrinomonadaceae bacterium]|nr:hypothetical protein [Pyrinomonadaceae bacterium]
MTGNYFNQKCGGHFRKIGGGCLMLIFAAGFLFALRNDAAAQRKSPPKTADKILFEVSRRSFGSGNRREKTLFIFQNGRVNCETSESLRGKKSSVKKAGCFQLNPTVVARLSKIASQPDFLSAEEDYFLSGDGIDYSSGIKIISFLDNGGKEIDFQTSDGDDDVFPVSVEKFVVEIVKIDNSFKPLPKSE